jgi:hypothetical protein
MSQPRRLKILVLIALLPAAVCTACGGSASAHGAKHAARSASSASPSAARWQLSSVAAAYSGTNERGVPRYFSRTLSPDAVRILRQAFGVVTPSHLYVSDSSRYGLLKYDPETKRCATCYVNSYRIGFVSVRKPGESWDDLERRMPSLGRGAYPKSSLVTSSSVSTMDPDIQGEVAQMLDAARRAGFHTHIVSTYRSPEQEAVLMHEGGGRTHTLTSLHSYGRAIDIRIDDGNLNNRGTRRDWIAFRRWVTRFRGDDFHVLGTPDQSWDWPHVELPSDNIGFRSVDAAVKAGRDCLSNSSMRGCEFRPHLPAAR